MVKRIVKLTFQPALVPQFLAIYEESLPKIRAFEGNLHVELLRSTAQPNVLFTLSHWQSEEALENYRRSGLFEATWARTKVLFADRPEAWTVVEMEDGRMEVGEWRMEN
jgi:hypothetical protein